MRNISIKALGSREKMIWGLRAYLGRITINNFSEKIYVPIEYWTLEDYKRQWQEGLKKIETADRSCLVATVQADGDIVSLINLWALYKQKDKIVIENCQLVGKELSKTLKGRPFTPDNCYELIPPMSRSKKVSRWLVDL